ncbi:CPBP family glutamic-type intramembrane protease [Chitinophaga lutea]
MMGALRGNPPYIQLTLALGLMLACMLFFGIFANLVFPAISGGYTMIEALDPAVAANGRALFAVKITQFFYTLTAFLLPAWIMALLLYPRPAEFLGLTKAPKVEQLGLALLALLCAIPFVGLAAEWNETWPLGEYFRTMEKMAAQQTRIILNMPDAASLIENLVLIALLPAVCEEFFFRGVIQRIVSKWTRNGWVGAIIAGAIFSLIHFQMLTFMPRWVLGFVIGAVFFSSGNLWLCIAAHFLNNGLQVVLVYLYQARMIEYDVLREQDHVPAVYGIAGAVLCGILLWRLHNSARKAGQTFWLPDGDKPSFTAKQDF